MTEIHHARVSAKVEGRICDINLNGFYTCSVLSTSDGLFILFADGRTLARLTFEACEAAMLETLDAPRPFVAQVLALLTGRKLCRCGGDFERKPHACPRKVNINGDAVSLCTCCEGCESACLSSV